MENMKLKTYGSAIAIALAQFLTPDANAVISAPNQAKAPISAPTPAPNVKVRPPIAAPTPISPAPTPAPKTVTVPRAKFSVNAGVQTNLAPRAKAKTEAEIKATKLWEEVVTDKPEPVATKTETAKKDTVKSETRPTAKKKATAKKEAPKAEAVKDSGCVALVEKDTVVVKDTVEKVVPAAAIKDDEYAVKLTWKDFGLMGAGGAAVGGVFLLSGYRRGKDGKVIAAEEKPVAAAATPPEPKKEEEEAFSGKALW